VAPGKRVSDLWRLGPSDNWYDLTIRTDSEPAFLRRFAGKVETGAPGGPIPASARCASRPDRVRPGCWRRAWRSRSRQPRAQRRRLTWRRRACRTGWPCCPSPAPGSPQDNADLALFRATRALEGSPRWRMATDDVTNAPLDRYACAMGMRIDARRAPALAALLDRIGTGEMVGPVKEHYRKARPYLGTDAPICEPRTDHLARNGDYPSGHAANGWLEALVLVQLLPDRATPLLARARAYGESRVICGVHSHSAVQAGWLAGSAMFAMLQTSPAYHRDLAAAARELARLRAHAWCRTRPPAHGKPNWSGKDPAANRRRRHRPGDAYRARGFASALPLTCRTKLATPFAFECKSEDGELSGNLSQAWGDGGSEGRGRPEGTRYGGSGAGRHRGAGRRGRARDEHPFRRVGPRRLSPEPVRNRRRGG
jgi:acid phosphatase (class A)